MTRLRQIQSPTALPAAAERAVYLLAALIAEQRDQARAERERLERWRATMDEADRASSQVLIEAQAAAITSRLTRLRAAASLAKGFAALRASEADSLKHEPRRPDATGSENDAAPDRDVVRTDADDPAQERVFAVRPERQVKDAEPSAIEVSLLATNRRFRQCGLLS